MSKIIKEFIEKGANLEHMRWARWQIWCHKVLRENCSSPELENVLERWEIQIATEYKDLSEEEKESDRKETRNYLPLLEEALAKQKKELHKECQKYIDAEGNVGWQLCERRIKKALTQQEEKLSKQMAGAIIMSKAGWIEEGELKGKADLLKKIEELNKWLWRQGTSKKDLTIPDISKKLQDIKK